MGKELAKKYAAGLSVSIALLVLSFSAQASGLPSASYAAVGADTSVPYGWIDFCNRYKGECSDATRAPLDINLTAETFKEIEKVGKDVNKSVVAVSDKDHWGVLDQWDYPTDGKGDCEDYALQKRKILIEEGFPRQALLMTVVKDEQNEGHAILTVKTNRGEFVLDNLTNELQPWNRTGYRFVKRQSQSNESIWVQIGPPTSAPSYVSR